MSDGGDCDGGDYDGGCDGGDGGGCDGGDGDCSCWGAGDHASGGDHYQPASHGVNGNEAAAGAGADNERWKSYGAGIEADTGDNSTSYDDSRQRKKKKREEDGGGDDCCILL